MHKESGISGYKGLSLVRILALGMQVWDLNSWTHSAAFAFC